MLPLTLDPEALLLLDVVPEALNDCWQLRAFRLFPVVDGAAADLVFLVGDLEMLFVLERSHALRHVGRREARSRHLIETIAQVFDGVEQRSADFTRSSRCASHFRQIELPRSSP